MYTLAVIPTYNERENLLPLVSKILDLGLKIKILIVDDNSPDGTGALADTMAASDKRITVLHRPAKEGLGKAYRDGFRAALADPEAANILQMDADLSHDPSYIPAFIREIQDCDLVIGSRFYGGQIRIVNWPLLRLALSYGASIYVRFFSCLSISDPTGGFKCFKRHTVERLLANNIISDGYAFQIETNYICRKLGFKIKELPIIFYDREKGASKMSTSRTILEALSIVWRLKFKRLV